MNKNAITVVFPFDIGSSVEHVHASYLGGVVTMLTVDESGTLQAYVEGRDRSGYHPCENLKVVDIANELRSAVEALPEFGGAELPPSVTPDDIKQGIVEPSRPSGLKPLRFGSLLCWYATGMYRVSDGLDLDANGQPDEVFASANWDRVAEYLRQHAPDPTAS